jgi:hypothetical protein
MGYDTTFEGWFDLNKPLTEAHKNYLNRFSKTRRMKRDEAKAAELEDPIREAVSLPVGPEGCYFVGAGGLYGQDKDESVIEYNYPPSNQPGLWCQWIPNEDGTQIRWDEGEKFYSYVKWLEYMIKHLLNPWGYTLNGKVRWQGEDMYDLGTITVKNNKVTTKRVSW